MITHDVIPDLLNDLVCDVWRRERLGLCALLFEFNDSRFKKALVSVSQRIKTNDENDAIGQCKLGQFTIGASMISSYARRPYFSVGFPGRLTTKS